MSDAEIKLADTPEASAPQVSDFDYSYVHTKARIAVYDDMKSAPRIIEIAPAKTNDFIEELALKTYENSQNKGGSVSFWAIHEVTENFIHAHFEEVVVSIMDGGNTIRFADQGPGIHDKNKAQRPGFTSAIEQMKPYIRGVGSGLPLAKEYIESSKGTITIEDNLESGAVVTLSMESKPVASSVYMKHLPLPQLTERERTFIHLLFENGALRVTDLASLANCPQSSTHVTLQKLEEGGLIERTGSSNKQRILTDYGSQVSQNLFT